MNIRLGNVKDLTQLCSLWTELFSMHCSWGYAFEVSEEMAKEWVRSFEHVLGRFAFLWVVEEDGEIRGFLLMRLLFSPAYMGRQSIAQISELYVNEACRNKNVGKRLVALAFEKATELDVHSVEVQAMVRNCEGQNFWEKQGLLPELVKFRKLI